MLAVRAQKSKVIERVLRTKTGQFVLATFLVVEYQGRVRAKLLSAIPVEAGEAFEAQEASFVALPAPILKTVFEKVISFGEVIISPFIDFAFLMSQPTRAPSN